MLKNIFFDEFPLRLNICYVHILKYLKYQFNVLYLPYCNCKSFLILLII